MQTTRQRILEYLEHNSIASSIELSRIFQLTPANIRHHLRVLLEANLVENAGEIGGSGRGRPTKFYRQTPQAQGHNLEMLSTVLFKQLLGSRPSQQRKNRLRAVADQLFQGADSKKETITQRFVAAVEHLNHLNYKSRWEASADSPRLIFGQCPYAAIIDEHPALCQMDTYMVENLLGEQVKQTAKISKEFGGQKTCVFILNSK